MCKDSQHHLRGGTVQSHQWQFLISSDDSGCLHRLDALHTSAALVQRPRLNSRASLPLCLWLWVRGRSSGVSNMASTWNSSEDEVCTTWILIKQWAVCRMVYCSTKWTTTLYRCTRSHRTQVNLSFRRMATKMEIHRFQQTSNIRKPKQGSSRKLN